MQFNLVFLNVAIFCGFHYLLICIGFIVSVLFNICALFQVLDCIYPFILYLDIYFSRFMFHRLFILQMCFLCFHCNDHLLHVTPILQSVNIYQFNYRVLDVIEFLLIKGICSYSLTVLNSILDNYLNNIERIIFSKSWFGRAYIFKSIGFMSVFHYNLI